jgi:hypothetical protein
MDCKNDLGSKKLRCGCWRERELTEAWVDMWRSCVRCGVQAGSDCCRGNHVCVDVDNLGWHKKIIYNHHLYIRTC